MTLQERLRLSAQTQRNRFGSNPDSDTMMQAANALDAAEAAAEEVKPKPAPKKKPATKKDDQ